LGWLIASQGVRDYVARRRENRRLEDRLEQTRRRVDEKRARLGRAAKDDAFLELEARRHLGLVRPDEVEFRFVSSTAPGQGERLEKRHGANP
jgi:cell division protein FtsB